MFCNKCGAKLPDGAGFCQGCGEKIVNPELTSTPVEQASTSQQPVEVQPKPAAPVQQGDQPNFLPVQQWSSQPEQPAVKKKEPKKKLIVLGAAALAVIAVVLAVVLKPGGKIPVETELTETYTNQDMGISFRYPSDWTLTKNETVFESIEMIHTENTKEHRASINIFPDTADPLGVFDGDENSIKEQFADTGITFAETAFISLEDAEISGFPAKKVTCRGEDILSGKNNVIVYYYYQAGKTIGMLEFSCAEDTLDVYAPVFEKILESYTATIPAAPEEEDIYYVTEDVTLYYDGDENSWITLYLDGTFLMRVNLYEGYGFLSGVYEGTSTGFSFVVTDIGFYGFLGDDLERFEMIVTDSGLQYKGDDIGTTYDGVIFY